MIPDLQNADLFRQSAFIGGEWAPADTASVIEVDDPATGAIIGTVPDCSTTDTERAITAANEAFDGWRSLSAGARCAILERWHALVLENSADLARIMTAEQGKPLAEAEGEVRYAASFIKWFAEEGRRASGHDALAPEPNRRIFVMKEPIGVAAAITPWNFPAAMITRKCAPALVAGCPVVVKPSDFTPYTALALARLAELAGFPKGTVSILTGRPEAIGGAITSNRIVRKLSFTGSTRVGSLLLRQCANTVKRTSMELGGNAPLIVFDDADIEIAVQSTMASKFRNSGQACVCANRILVQDGIFDTFAARLAKEVSALSVGPGNRAESTIGPLINTAAAQKVNVQVDDALSKGATLFASGQNTMTYDRFVTPVVLSGANRDMVLATQETFGPLAPLFRFRDEDEAIELANATDFGLASYFFTENLHRAFRVAERLESGMVALNTGSLAIEMAPFGGIKQSGLGREGGREGIEEYLETKAFHIGGLKL